MMASIYSAPRFEHSRPTKRMKMTSSLTSLAGCFLTAIFSTAGLALTVDQQVTPAYIRDHPKEFSVKVRKDKNGLFAFTVVRTLSEPKYLVAHLAVLHQGKIIAESHTPSFAKKNDNTFYFSISPEHAFDSTFELGESPLTDGVPLPGTINYQFHLRDFVPEGLLRSATKQ